MKIVSSSLTGSRLSRSLRSSRSSSLPLALPHPCHLFTLALVGSCFKHHHPWQYYIWRPMKIALNNGRAWQGKGWEGREGRAVNWWKVSHYVQLHQKVPSCIYAYLVLCLERSRALPFFVHFTESPTISDSTDELASILYEPSAGIAEGAIPWNQIGRIDRTSIQKIRSPVALLIEIPSMQDDLSKPLFFKIWNHEQQQQQQSMLTNSRITNLSPWWLTAFRVLYNPALVSKGQHKQPDQAQSHLWWIGLSVKRSRKYIYMFKLL